MSLILIGARELLAVYIDDLNTRITTVVTPLGMPDSGFRFGFFAAWVLLFLSALCLCLPLLPVLFALRCQLLASCLVVTLLRFCTSSTLAFPLPCSALSLLFDYLLFSLLLL